MCWGGGSRYGDGRCGVGVMMHVPDAKGYEGRPRQSRLSCPRKRASSHRRAGDQGSDVATIYYPAEESRLREAGAGRSMRRRSAAAAVACAGCVTACAAPPQDDGGGITGGAARSLARAFLLRPLHRLVGGLLRHAEMLADLPPVGAGLEGLLHGPLLRHAR